MRAFAPFLVMLIVSPLVADNPKEIAYQYTEARMAQFGLNDPRNELTVDLITAHPTVTHVRFSQRSHGIPVYATAFIVNVFDSGEVTHTGEPARDLHAMDPAPQVSRRRAMDIAVAAHEDSSGAVEIEAVTLEILPGNQRSRRFSPTILAWRVAISSRADLSAWETFVDARTGDVVERFDQTRDAAATYWYRSVNTYRPMYQQEVVGRQMGKYFAFWKQVDANSFSTRNLGILRDPCYGFGGSYPPCGIAPGSEATRVDEPYGNWVGDAKNRDTQRGKPFTMIWSGDDQAVVWGDGKKLSTNVTTVAADVYLAMADAHQYLRSQFGRNGVDGNDRETYALVNWSGGSARWAGTRCNCLLVGNGDGVLTYATASTDVIGHELGHGLNSYTVQFGIQYEAPGLDEAFADIFGTLVEHFKDQQLGGFGVSGFAANFSIGEQIFRANYNGSTFIGGAAFRRMDDPTTGSQPGLACWSGSLASLSSPYLKGGPMNHAFYLLAQGGTSKCNGNQVTGVGLEVASRLWFLSLFHLTPAATYHDVRNAFLLAAREGSFSSAEQAVDSAFAAIGVTP